MTARGTTLELVGPFGEREEYYRPTKGDLALAHAFDTQSADARWHDGCRRLSAILSDEECDGTYGESLTPIELPSHHASLYAVTLGYDETPGTSGKVGIMLYEEDLTDPDALGVAFCLLAEAFCSLAR